MSSGYKSDEKSMSLNEFERLLERYYTGNCTPEEEAWVSRWLANANLGQPNRWHELSSTQKQQYIDQLFSDITQTTGAASSEPRRPASRIRRLAWFGGVAASVCIIVMAYLLVQQQGAKPESATEWKTFMSEPGHRKQLQLADGTTIWLQGGSELSYPEEFSAGRRVVKLDGEAYFDVSRRPDMPFIVIAGDLETEVLGTSFNVEAFSALDKKVVSLIEGKVAVRIRDSTGMQRGSDIVLSPQEAAVFQVTENRLAKSELPVFGSPQDFKSGNLQFDETPMTEVLFRLGTAYGVDISYDQEKAKAHRITGGFTVSEPVDDVFKSLARSTGAQYNRTGKAITLSF